MSKQLLFCSANNYREVKKTTTITTTGRSLKKSFYEHDHNGCVRALQFLVWPSSAKQQSEMTKFCEVWRTWTRTANVLILSFSLKFIAVSQIQSRDSFDGDKQSKGLSSIARFVVKIEKKIFNGAVLGVAVVVTLYPLLLPWNVDTGHKKSTRRTL